MRNLIVALAIPLLLANTAVAQDKDRPEGYAVVVEAFSLVGSSSKKRIIAKVMVSTKDRDDLGLSNAIQDAIENVTKVATTYGINRVRKIGKKGLVDFEATRDQLDHLLEDPTVTLSRIYIDVPQPANLNSSLPFVEGNLLHNRSPAADGSGGLVAILDTGVDQNHKFFSRRIVRDQACFSTTSDARSKSLCPNGEDSEYGPFAGTNCSGIPGCDHGTHVAGIVASSNQQLTGFAPAARILPVQVFFRRDDIITCKNVKLNAPCLLTYSGDQIRALEWLLDRLEHGILPSSLYAVNMSLGGGKETTCDSSPLADIIKRLRARGVAVVISSGNNSYPDHVNSPGCISDAITVGAVCDSEITQNCTARAGSIAGFSNSGTRVDLLAPGVSVKSSVTTTPTNRSRSRNKSGTSMAAPAVAGGLAALQGYFGGRGIDIVERHLKQTGDQTPMLNARRSRPQVRFDKALEELRKSSAKLSEYVSMRDTWNDTGREPDPATVRMAMHNSPDIWIRRNESMKGGWCQDNQHEHQSPIAKKDNFGCVKLRNRSREFYQSGTLEIYAARPNLNSTASVWGRPIFKKFLQFEPFQSQVVEFFWDNKRVPGAGHFCLLARWRPNGENSPLKLPGGVSQAVRNSNNLIWRNLVVIDGQDQRADASGRVIAESSFSMEPGINGKINLVIDIASLSAAEIDSLGELVLSLGGYPEALVSEPTSKYYRHDGRVVIIPLKPGVYYIPGIVPDNRWPPETNVRFELIQRERNRDAPEEERRNATLAVNIVAVSDVGRHKEVEGGIDGPGIQFNIVEPLTITEKMKLPKVP